MNNQETKLEKVFSAREFAARAHAEQKYGTDPYLVHLDEVASLCLLHLPGIGTWDPAEPGGRRFRHLIVDCLVAAYLHDVVEDTLTTMDEIAAQFGTEAALRAHLLSDPPGKSRRERKAALHRRLELTDERSPVGAVVIGVKVMDRLANLRRSAAGNPDLLDMYRRESEAFKKACFRTGMCGQAWAEIGRLSSP
jgi:(p)ppGpp synthase/HD superfamily hydrolase